MPNTQIYIRFVDGADVFIPIDAEIKSVNTFQLLDSPEFDYDDGTILFEYGFGDVVKGEFQLVGEMREKMLVATQLMESGSKQNEFKRLLFQILHKLPNPEEVFEIYDKRVVEQLLNVDKIKYPELIYWCNEHKAVIQSFIK